MGLTLKKGYKMKTKPDCWNIMSDCCLKNNVVNYIMAGTSYVIMTWFIRYQVNRNLKSLNHVRNIKTKILLPQAYEILAD